MSEGVQPPLLGGSTQRRSWPTWPALRGVLLALAVFVFALTQFLPAVDDREFHRDEARWIHRAVYIRDLFSPLSDVWDEETWTERGRTMDEQYRLRAQPPLGSYIMGIGFLVQDGKLPDIGFWNMDYDDAWNAEAGNMPTEVQLHTGRRTNAFVSALTAVAIFFTTRRITNDLGGVVAGVFFALHPLAIYIATFAGSDAVLGLTIALAAVAAYRFSDRPTWGRAAMLGIVIGLGGAAKLSPLGIAFALAGIGALLLAGQLLRWPSSRNSGIKTSAPADPLRADEPGYHRREATGAKPRTQDTITASIGALPGHHGAVATGARRRRWGLMHAIPPQVRMAIGLLATPVVAGIAFVASYPYLWRDPVGNALNLLDYRTLGMELQSSLWEGISVDSRTEAFARIGDRLGSSMTALGRLTSLGGQTLSIELAIGAAGIVLLGWLAMRRGMWSTTALAGVVLLSEAAITVYGLEADWARYHLPILILQATGIGIVSGWLLQSVLGALRPDDESPGPDYDPTAAVAASGDANTPSSMR